MSDWNNNQGGSAHRNSFGQDDWTSGGQAENTSTSNDGFEVPVGASYRDGAVDTHLSKTEYNDKQKKRAMELYGATFVTVEVYAVIDRDVDDVKEAVGNITYRQLQEA
ncbi:hexamer-binding protein [Fusarium globosum]|uniref:Hexamer-binding protein n=1 Tax=Fusarium globosum TaxID=78864 RepID=A0A8H5XMP2_9HYPO|nr:hexamer-binding protein [Fusarium globosum]